MVSRKSMADLQKEQRVPHIREVAHQTLAEAGYEGLTMRGLAEKCGMSVPTLYNLIGGKDEILAQDAVEAFRRVVRATEAKSGGDAIDRTLNLYDAMLDEIMGDEAYYQAFLPYSSSVVELRSFHERGARLYQSFLGAILNARKTQDFDDSFKLDLAITELYDLSMAVIIKWSTGSVETEQLRHRLYYGISLILGSGMKGAAKEKITLLGQRAAEGIKPK